MVNYTMNVCSLYGIKDLRYEAKNIPSIQKDEVLVKIRAAGICGSDIERVYTQGTYHYPTIIGHEFAGEVVETNIEDRSTWLNRRVAIFPLIPCNKCEQCKMGNYQLCSNYDYYGSRRDGGFSEFQSIKKWNLLKLPDNVSYESAAMFEPAAVSIHALRQFKSLFGKTLIIYGVGTIALIMAQIANVVGCKNVILIARSNEKVDIAKKYGFNNTINSNVISVKDFISDLTKGKGADIIVEGCGKAETLSDALVNIKAGGEIVCMGNPVDDIIISRDIYWKILRKQVKVMGTWNSAYGSMEDDWHTVMDYVSSGRLNLEQYITSRYSFSQCKEAFDNAYYKKVGNQLKSMFINN